jgi:uncharacterized protein YecT (DUF1311 family)
VRVLEAFETSQSLTEKGRECEIEFEGKVICVVTVRPADAMLNSDYRKAAADLAQELKATVKDVNNLEPGKDNEYLFRLYVRSVITSWTWTDPADKKDPKLKFSEKNATALFAKAPKFFEAIQKVARTWSHFRAQTEKDIAGN